MRVRETGQTIVALGVMCFIAYSALSQPTLTRQTAEYAMDLWWNHIVPLMLPGYVLTQCLIAFAPQKGVYLLPVAAAMTFPPLAAVVVFDLSRHRRLPQSQILPLLLYTNLYNPLIFQNVGFGILLDLALAASALLLMALPRRQPIFTAPPIQPRRWILDGMNWTTIVGVSVLAACLIHQWFKPLPLGWIIDPVAMHWSREPISLKAVYWSAFGGLIYWIPLFNGLRQNGLPWKAPLLFRATQAGLATLAIGLVLHNRAV